MTQQIKLLEEYLAHILIDRKKNGVKLTNAGEELFRISTKLEKQVLSAERDLAFSQERYYFILGASAVIGNYILPEFLDDIQKNQK